MFLLNNRMFVHATPVNKYWLKTSPHEPWLAFTKNLRAISFRGMSEPTSTVYNKRGAILTCNSDTSATWMQWNTLLLLNYLEQNEQPYLK